MKHTLVLLLLAAPLFAQQHDNEVSFSYGRIEVEDARDLYVVGASYNRYWSQFISTRVGVFGGSDELPDNNGDASSRLVYAAVEAHAWRGRLFSPHIGAGAAYAYHVEDYLGSNEKDSGVTPAVIAGLDVNLTPRFSIGADALYSHFGVETGNDRFARDLTSLAVLGSARFRW